MPNKNVYINNKYLKNESEYLGINKIGWHFGGGMSINFKFLIRAVFILNK